jgi:uncharacterized membrane protein YesL
VLSVLGRVAILARAERAGMVTPGKALWDTLQDAYDAALEVLKANLLWFLFSLPIISVPAATAGAYYFAYRLVQHRTVSARTFFEGIRLYAWAGYRFFLLNLVAIVILAVNFSFYGRIQEQWATWVQGIMVGLLVIWLAMNIFTFPLYLIQTEKKLRVALRNSMVFYLRQPGMCLSLIAFLFLLAAISTLLSPAWLFFSVILCLMLCCRFTLLMLENLGYYPAEDNRSHVDSD